MAYATKYRLNFIDNASDAPVEVRIMEDGYVGDVTQLKTGQSPLIVTENISNDKLFGIRSKSATIEFISDGSVSIEDFLSPNDNKYRVEIDVAGSLWLVTFLLSDQLSESWYTDGTQHYVKLTATDNLGAIKEAPLVDISGNPYVPSTKQLLSTIVISALEQAIPGLDLVIYDNLFAVGQTSRGVSNTLDAYQQTRVDMRTFVTNFTQFEPAFSVLEKIILSRKSVLLQHNGEWVIMRVQELFTGDSIPGTRYLSGGGVQAVTFNESATLSASGDMLPVNDFMLKRYSLPVQRNRCQFDYTPFEEVVCNQLWRRGSIVVDTPSLREYSVECWSHLRGAVTSTTPSTATFRRREVIDTATEQVTENYIYMTREALSGNESFIKSESALVSKDDKFNIQFSHRLRNNYGGAQVAIVARVLLYANDLTYYTLDASGKWFLSNASFTVNNKTISHGYASADDKSQWVEKSIQCDFLPKDGQIFILLYEYAAGSFTGQETHYRDLKIEYIPYLDGKRAVTVTGDYDQLSITGPKPVNDYSVFLSDSPKFLFKGALFLANGTTLTTLWYEWPNVFVQFTLKRWNAIAEWRLSYINRMKVEASTRNWISGSEVIHPLAKITASTGDSNKRFLPISITDNNCQNSDRRLDLLEVSDETEVIQPTILFRDVVFNATTDAFTVVVLPSNYMFYIGDQYQITGTTSNNLTFTVTSVTPGINGSYTIGTNAALTNETAATASFKLLTNSQNLVDAVHEFSYIYGNR